MDMYALLCSAAQKPSSALSLSLLLPLSLSLKGFSSQSQAVRVFPLYVCILSSLMEGCVIRFSIIFLILLRTKGPN